MLRSLFVFMIAVVLCGPLFGGEDAVDEVVCGVPVGALTKWVKGEVPPSVFGIRLGMSVGDAKKALAGYKKSFVAAEDRVDVLAVQLADGVTFRIVTGSDLESATPITNFFLYFESVNEADFVKIWKALSCVNAYVPNQRPSAHEEKDSALKILGEGRFNRGMNSTIWFSLRPDLE